MRRGPRHLTPDEARLWRRVTARDKPLRPSSESADDSEALTSVAEPRAAISQKPVKSSRAEAKAGPAKAAPRRAHNFGEERKVRRGKLEVEGRIDLHGMTQRAAESALSAFLQNARGAQKRCVLVITGKGSPDASWPEPQRGVLRRRLPEWLDAFARDGLVSGYASAHRNHGGEGAFYVFLKLQTK